MLNWEERKRSWYGGLSLFFFSPQMKEENRLGKPPKSFESKYLYTNIMLSENTKEKQ